MIKLPDSITKSMSQTELIKFTFPDIFKEKYINQIYKINHLNIIYIKTILSFMLTTSKVILATTNTTVDQINNIATNIMKGLEHIKLSFDNIIEDSNQHLYPTKCIDIL